MDSVIHAIDEALERSGLSDAAASKLAVGNYSLIKNMRSARGDEKRYSFQALQQLANVLGLECYFGPKRAIQGFAEGGDEGSLSRAEALRSGYLPIPWHPDAKLRGSAPVAFMRSWLASEGISPENLAAVMPAAVHLSITRSKNTVAILDTTAARKGNTGYWGYRDSSGIALCRAAFAPGITMLFPEGDDGPVRMLQPETRTEVTLLGKVVWLGILPQV